MDNKILLQQIFSFWPQVKILRWVPELDSHTQICILNFKGHKTLLILDNLIYTSKSFGELYLQGRMNQLKTLMIKYKCHAGIIITANKNLSNNLYKQAMIKQINLIDLNDLNKICEKLNCSYLINFLTVDVNLDLLNP